ncbi:HpcH/HpaI aldolase family protein [Haladaptatus pallidirubidus]|uniref:2-keto-3-deoxy-L-rhamnonate aldolase n=1 Tax=Haladaptatus pallidirubidus TaxID=1008152 RepID=A0AAV3UK18_9EURY|nr:aldolase/citrate lyase family protein [Haladaptatus pallidirubidus]
MVQSRNTTSLRKRLENDEITLGMAEDAYSPTLIELYGGLGLDFVWIDFEHAGPSPWDATAVEQLLRASELTGTELLVRVPVTEPALVRKALDAGVRNVFLSHVDTADEVRDIVRAAYFHYDGEPGERGLAIPRASRWGLDDDYAATEDEDVLIGVTIESLEAVENIDSILDVPSLGFVFIGPFDLSVAVGHPGELDHPDVQDAIETVRSRSVERGVPVGGLGFGMSDVNEKANNGYQMLNIGTTTIAIQEIVAEWLDEYERS